LLKINSLSYIIPIKNGGHQKCQHGATIIVNPGESVQTYQDYSSNTRSNAPAMPILDGAETIISGLKDAASKMYFNFSGAVGPGEAFVVEYK